MSAFLFYSQDKREAIKCRFPGIKNTEISRMLGKMWREATKDEKLPYIIHEGKERKKYKVEVEKWRGSKQEQAELFNHNDSNDSVPTFTAAESNDPINVEDGSELTSAGHHRFGIPEATSENGSSYYSSYGYPYPHHPHAYPNPYHHPYYGYYNYANPYYPPPQPTNHYCPHPPSSPAQNTRPSTPDDEVPSITLLKSPLRSRHPWDVFDDVEQEMCSNTLV